MAAVLVFVMGCASPIGAQGLTLSPRLTPRAQAIVDALKADSDKPQEKIVMLELDGEVNDASVEPLIAKMKELDAAGQPEIWLKLNSNGGSVSSGLDLITTIEGLHARTTCVADWRSMSMAFSILESCNQRLAVPQALMMMHAPSTEVAGKASALKQDIEILQAMRTIMVGKLAKRLKISREEIEHHMDTHDYFITVEEATKIGAIDGIIEVKDLPALTKVDPPEQNVLQFLLR